MLSTLALFAAVASVAAQDAYPFVGSQTRHEGFQHEVLFVEVGEQAGFTREAIREHADALDDIIDGLQANVVAAIDADGAATQAAFGLEIADIQAALGVQYAEIVDGAQAHAEQLYADIGAQFAQTQDLINQVYDELDAEHGAQTNQTQQFIQDEAESILEGAASIDEVVAAMQSAAAAVVDAAEGAQTAAEMIIGLGPQIAEDLVQIEADFELIDDFAEQEIRMMRQIILEQIMVTREETQDRDNTITRILDVVKSGSLLNSLLITRNIDLLAHFKSSTSSETSTSSFSSFRNHY